VLQVETPLEEAKQLSEDLGNTVLLKREDLQPVSRTVLCAVCLCPPKPYYLVALSAVSVCLAHMSHTISATWRSTTLPTPTCVPIAPRRTASRHR
jgi:hypothetical protein